MHFQKSTPLKSKITYYILCLFVLLINKIHSQENLFNNEITIISDNDAYLLVSQDQYYTNGIDLSYSFGLSKSIENTKPKIVSISLNHQIHSSRRYMYEDKLFWDTPTVGYLSLKGVLTKIINEKSFINYNVELAQTGPNAQGKEVQKLIHSLFNMYNVKSWQNELPNKLGVNLGFNYHHELFTNSNRNLELSGFSQTTIGSLITNTSLGISIRLGKIKKMDASVFSKANLVSNETNNEFFVTYEPSIYYQLKNFTNGDSYVYESNIKRTNHIEPFYFKHSLGITYAKNRSLLKFSLIQYTQQIKKLDRKFHQYGQISFGYRF